MDNVTLRIFRRRWGLWRHLGFVLHLRVEGNIQVSTHFQLSSNPSVVIFHFPWLSYLEYNLSPLIWFHALSICYIHTILWFCMKYTTTPDCTMSRYYLIYYDLLIMSSSLYHSIHRFVWIAYSYHAHMLLCDDEFLSESDSHCFMRCNHKF